MDPLWNPRKAVPDSEVIIARFIELSAWVRSNVSCRLDQPYGTRPRESFDIFLPDGNLEGLHIFIHGGFWMSRDKSIFSFLADGYIRRQWAFAIPNFPLMPFTRIEQMVSSIRQACEDIWGQYARPLNALPWTISGHSSGAHLVSQAVLVNKPMSIPEPSSVALISGAYDLEAVRRSEVNTSLDLSEHEVLQQCTLKQSLRLVSSSIKLYVGAREPEVWTNQSQALAAKLKSVGYGDSGNPVNLAGHDHFSILEPLAQPQSEIGRQVLNLY
jgi:arylformamidase